MPNFTGPPVPRGRPHGPPSAWDRLDRLVEESEQRRPAVRCPRGQGKAAAGHDQVAGLSSSPGPGEQLGRQQRVAVEALLEVHSHRERAGEELLLEEPPAVPTHALQHVWYFGETFDEGAIALV